MLHVTKQASYGHYSAVHQPDNLSQKTPNIRRSIVQFNIAGVTVREIPTGDRRRMSSAYFRGLINKCSMAQKELYIYLERLTHGGIFPLSQDPEEDPLKVNNPNVSWDEDESPIELLSAYKKQPMVTKDLFGLLLKHCQGRKRGIIIRIPYRDYQIRICCSGTGFRTPIIATRLVIVQQFSQKQSPTPPVKPVKTLSTHDDIQSMLDSINAPMGVQSLNFEFENMFLS